MHRSALTNSQKTSLYQTCLFQRLKRTISRNRLERARAQFHCYMTIQLRYPDSLGFEVRQKQTRRVGGNMPSNTSFFLGQTAPVYDMALRGLRPGYVTYSRHSAFSFVESRENPRVCHSRQGKTAVHDAGRLRFALKQTCATVASA